jgi:large subunit ribosomal protein L18
MSGRHDQVERRRIRRYRIRKRVAGTAERPGSPCSGARGTSTPSSWTTSAAHAGRGLEPRRRVPAGEGPRKIALSSAVGRRLAELAKAKGIARACFDRGGYRYHGRVKALADGARAAGLEF